MKAADEPGASFFQSSFLLFIATHWFYKTIYNTANGDFSLAQENLAELRRFQRNAEQVKWRGCMVQIDWWTLRIWIVIWVLPASRVRPNRISQFAICQMDEVITAEQGNGVIGFSMPTRQHIFLTSTQCKTSLNQVIYGTDFV